MFACQPVGLEFCDSAPIRLSAAVRVGWPPSEVFAAFAHDPVNWGEFFPGFDMTGRYLDPGPHGVDSQCRKRVVGITVEETVLVWDEGKRFAFRVDSVSVPVFHAWVEDYRFQPDGRGGTVLRVAIAGRLRHALRLTRPILPRTLAIVFGRVARNLEQGHRTPRLQP